MRACWRAGRGVEIGRRLPLARAGRQPELAVAWARISVVNCGTGRAFISAARTVSRTKSCIKRRLAEAHFSLRRMHIDIDFAGRHLQKQQHHGINRGRNDVAVGFGQRVLHQAVANQAPVDEYVDRIAIQLLDLRLGDEAVQRASRRDRRGFSSSSSSSVRAPRRRLGQADALEGLQGGHGNQLVQRLFAEDLIDALAVSRHRRRDQHGVGGGVQLEMLFRMRQRVVRDQRRDVRQLGGLGLQKFLSRREY